MALSIAGPMPFATAVSAASLIFCRKSSRSSLVIRTGAAVDICPSPSVEAACGPPHSRIDGGCRRPTDRLGHQAAEIHLYELVRRAPAGGPRLCVGPVAVVVPPRFLRLLALHFLLVLRDVVIGRG